LIDYTEQFIHWVVLGQFWKPQGVNRPLTPLTQLPTCDIPEPPSTPLPEFWKHLFSSNDAGSISTVTAILHLSSTHVAQSTSPNCTHQIVLQDKFVFDTPD
jgi:hypothetical protein